MNSNTPIYPDRMTPIPYTEDQIGTGAIYRSTMPTKDEIYTYKERLGITTVVQLCEDSEFTKQHREGTLKAYHELGLNHIKFPIQENAPPESAKGTRKLAKQIVKLAKEGEKILIHDLLGRGRTALIVACITRRVFGYEAKDSISFAKRYVPKTRFSLKQEEFINLFIDKNQDFIPTPHLLLENPTISTAKLIERPFKRKISGNLTFIPLPEEKIGTGKIYRCKMPLPQEALAYKKEYGISTVITLCEHPEFSKYGCEKTLDAYKELQIKVIPFPIKDYGVADKEGISSLLNEILSETKEGNNVLIHCFAGHGRTGMVLACFAGLACGMSGEEAGAFIKSFIPKAIETQNQKVFVNDFLKTNGPK